MPVVLSDFFVLANADMVVHLTVCVASKQYFILTLSYVVFIIHYLIVKTILTQY